MDNTPEGLNMVMHEEGMITEKEKHDEITGINKF